jgi:hypothetical protein
MIAKAKYVKSNWLCKTGVALTFSILTFSLLCMASSNAAAQVSKTVTREGAEISKTTPKATTVIPSAQPRVEDALPAGATVIYSNFGTGDSLYNGGSGWTEAGEEANDYPLAEAMAFVPRSDYVLVRIDAAITWVSGTNGTQLVLAIDNAGVPGKPIYIASMTNLPDFGTCCTIQTAKINPANRYIKLIGGHKYWLYPLPADTTSYLVWNTDTTNKGGKGAVSENYGSSWTAAPLSPFGAFDVYGLAPTE